MTNHQQEIHAMLDVIVLLAVAVIIAWMFTARARFSIDGSRRNGMNCNRQPSQTCLGIGQHAAGDDDQTNGGTP